MLQDITQFVKFDGQNVSGFVVFEELFVQQDSKNTSDVTAEAESRISGPVNESMRSIAVYNLSGSSGDVPSVMLSKYFVPSDYEVGVWTAIRALWHNRIQVRVVCTQCWGFLPSRALC